MCEKMEDLHNTYKEKVSNLETRKPGRNDKFLDDRGSN